VYFLQNCRWRDTKQ